MVTEQQQIDWSIDLIDSLWFYIGNYLTTNDIHRLSRTCSRLHALFTSNDFWSSLIHIKFGHAIWHRFIKNSLFLTANKNFSDLINQPCRSKLIYFELIKRKRISFSDFQLFSFDTNRKYTIVADASSLNDHVLYINDSIELCYSLHIETTFKNILPGKYDVIWRMKLNLPYMLGETEFFAVAKQTNPGQIGYTRWTQDDFLSMYRCFNCDLTKTNLWFYQTMGIVEINGTESCDVYISMTNHDTVHAKYGLFLDYVELKLRFE